MSKLTTQIEELSQELSRSIDRIGLERLESDLAHQQSVTQLPGFWDNPNEAQANMKRLSQLQARVEPWVALRSTLMELKELDELNDSSLDQEIEDQYQRARRSYTELKKELAFSGPYDDHNVILSIHAGAGGTDAQDWAQMLLRMYTRYAEQNESRPQLLEQSAGDEAGIKSATLELNMPFAYGKLKGEHGVHRLVRLSPFNSDNLRQTSFAKVDVLPKIEAPDEIMIDEGDLKVDVYRSGGHGGQSVNTTDSAVRITHLPTGLTVSIQNERSQLQNRETALTILRSRLAQLQIEQHKEHLTELKGPNQSAEWGNQIRSYVLHPYKQVKDLRTKYETSDPQNVLDGDLDGVINSYLDFIMTSQP